MRAAEMMKVQRRERGDSLESAQPATDDAVRNSMPHAANKSAVAGDEITKVRLPFFDSVFLIFSLIKSKLHCFLLHVSFWLDNNNNNVPSVL